MATSNKIRPHLDHFMELRELHNFEGQRGIESLEKVAIALGYSRDFNPTVLYSFLMDNSGAIEALLDWIRKQNSPEWVASLEKTNADLKWNPSDWQEVEAA